MSVTSPSLVAPDVVFLAAVRALPSELLEALQNAELCDPGILMAYPRGNVELIAPQASRKRFFAKKQSLPQSADQTFTSIPVVRVRIRVFLVLGYRIYLLLLLLSLYLHRLSRPSLLYLRLWFLARSVMNRSRLTGRRQLRGVKNCRQITARRPLRGAKSRDINQRTPRVQVDRAISWGRLVLRGRAWWKGMFMGTVVVELKGRRERCQDS